MSTDAGRTYLGDTIELRYRLPKLWAVTTTGRAPVWKARKIAQATKPLCTDAAAYVDRHLAHQAHRCSYAQIDRAIADALRLFDPAEGNKRHREAADARHFDVDLDLADAITAGATELGRLGCEESLDVRRSLAAGALARRELTLDLSSDAPAPRKRELMIYVHLSDSAVNGAVAGVENTRSAISIDQVKDWCAGTNTHVTIRPVIDLNDNLHTDAYRPTDAMREQAILTNTACVYPHCRRPSRTADLDHLDDFNLPRPPPLQNPRRLDRRTHRTHHVHLDQQVRLHLRLGHAAHPTYRLTPPRRHRWRGRTHVQALLLSRGYSGRTLTRAAPLRQATK